MHPLRDYSEPPRGRGSRPSPPWGKTEPVTGDGYDPGSLGSRRGSRPQITSRCGVLLLTATVVGVEALPARRDLRLVEKEAKETGSPFFLLLFLMSPSIRHLWTFSLYILNQN